MKKRILRLICLLLPTMLLAGCLHDDDASTQLFQKCNTPTQNRFVHSTMQEWYYWYDLMPDVDPHDFESPDALLDAVRYSTLDSTFSYITTQEAEDAFLNNAAYIGFGFSTTIKNGDELHLREVFPDAPAGLAGLGRGDRILAIDGEDVATLIAADTLQDAYGPSEVGVTRDFLVEHPDATQETISVTKDEVEIPVVLGAKTFDVNGATTGYVYFRSFNNAAFNALQGVFEQFANDGVTQLVLDLRYNGGGLISVAEYLGSLVGGDGRNGDVLSTMKFNDKKQAYNVTLRLSDLVESVPVTDLVVITTGSTASASELVVNGLDPYINVSTVGDTTFGKPVGQSGFRFCEKVLRAVTFETVNVNDVSGYFDGIAPTCAATDELAEPLGSLAEDSVEEAVHLLANGSCSATSAKASAEIAVQKAMYPQEMQYRDGWDVVTGGVR